MAMACAVANVMQKRLRIYGEVQRALAHGDLAESDFGEEVIRRFRAAKVVNNNDEDSVRAGALLQFPYRTVYGKCDRMTKLA